MYNLSRVGIVTVNLNVGALGRFNMASDVIWHDLIKSRKHGLDVSNHTKILQAYGDTATCHSDISFFTPNLEGTRFWKIS